MTAATITSKGQITIPAEIRTAHGLQPGHRLVFFTRLDGTLGVRVSKPHRDSGQGMIAHLGPPMTIEDMDEAIGAAIAEARSPKKTDESETGEP
jgi:AbrB family looped-hinge helix DNA binding protein